MGQITVLIVDDHESIRDGLRFMLTQEPGTPFQIMEQEGENGSQALPLYTELRPDILLMDVRMPYKSGVEAAVEIMALDTKANIVLFSAHDEPGLLTEALRAGCRGYVLKSAHSRDVVRAIHAVCSGGMYVDPALAAELAVGVNIPPAISPREVEVLSLLAQGMTNDSVADKLYISSETVRTHARHAREKLKAENTTHAVALALHHGLLLLEV